MIQIFVFAVFVVYSVVFFVDEYSDPDRGGDVMERTQNVYESRCEHQTERFYLPKNSYGFIFTSDGERVYKTPDCTTVKIGEANSIGGDLK